MRAPHPMPVLEKICPALSFAASGFSRPRPVPWELSSYQPAELLGQRMACGDLHKAWGMSVWKGAGHGGQPLLIFMSDV